MKVASRCESCGVSAVPPCPVCKTGKNATKPLTVGQVGTALKGIIPKLFRTKNCGCSAYANRMDDWGIEECERREAEIVDYLHRKAQSKLWGRVLGEVTRHVAQSWVRRAIEAEKKLHGMLPVDVDADWFVAVTTAPRKSPTLQKTVASLRHAGWEPILFAEPDTDVPHHCEAVQNTERLGVWHNWLSSCRAALDTGNPYVLTVQDDVVLHPQSKEFVTDVFQRCVPDGFVSLYTPKHYSSGNRSVGVNHIRTGNLWGACAIAWRREELARVVSHPIAKKWLGAPVRTRRYSSAIMQRRRDNPALVQNSDTAIGKICNALRLPMYFVDPSPARHVAKVSTIAHGDNTGRRNCSRCADHSKPLRAQVFPDGVEKRYQRQTPRETGNAEFDHAVKRWFDLGNLISFAITQELWEAIHAEVRPTDETLEFGCGVSTAAFVNSGNHTAVEQNRERARRFRSAVHSPMVGDWYEWEPEPEQTYRVILVDGPHGGCRVTGFDRIIAACNEDTVIFVDDTHREEEWTLAVAIAGKLEKAVQFYGDTEREFARIA